LTIGADIRNEKVTPSGTPASTKPINNGTAEHEQNGVTIPIRAASKLLIIGNLAFERNFFVFSGGKYDRISETKNMIIASSKIILIVS
jgi:hypothetical protein